MAIFKIQTPTMNKEDAQQIWHSFDNTFKKQFSGTVVEIDPSPKKTFDDAQSRAEEAKCVVEELKDELQSWLDSLPESLQQGSKADELQEAIDALEEIENSIDSITWPDDLDFGPPKPVVYCVKGTISGKGLRLSTTIKKVRCNVLNITTITKFVPASSRSDRLGEAERAMDEAKTLIDDLILKSEERTEEQNALVDLASDMDNVDFGYVNFPGMY